MGAPAFVQQPQEPSALMLTDSAIVGIESASQSLDRTVALPNKDSVPKAPVFAQTMPLAQPQPQPQPQPQLTSAPKQPAFTGTMPLGGSGMPSMALRPTEPSPPMAPPPPVPNRAMEQPRPAPNHR